MSAERIPDPCVLVIFGASGDLTRRKLLPAIWHLNDQGRLPEQFALVGVARSPMDDDGFRNYVAESIRGFVADSDAGAFDQFLGKLSYISGDPRDPETYALLNSHLKNIDQTRGTNRNRCFYCSVPPQVYLEIVEQLGKTGMHEEGSDDGWVRIIIEKPFGHDLGSAQDLNWSLHKVFAEHQIYRIDHYLGKETVQNILVFRLANSMFEPLWNRRYVDHVQITAAETVGIEHRAEYYEAAGALRDMIQNHLLQVMCVIAMEPPSAFDAEGVRIEKLKVLKSIRPFSIGEVDRYAVRAQYANGMIDGATATGYLQEEGVDRTSKTETYAAVVFTIDNWRWQGVPFAIRTGKRMAKRATAITLQFREPPHLIFQNSDVRCSTLTIRVQPEEGISLSFSGKTPGPDMDLGTVKMDFNYEDTFGVRSPEAYETLILDCFLGDATLYAHSDWIGKSWELLMPIQEAWSASSAANVPSYSAGSWGPSQSASLLAGEGRQWVEL